MAAYWPAYTSNEFVNYDDDIYITDNSHVKTGLKPANIVWAFRTFETANWHPLTWLSLQLDAQIYGSNTKSPRASHGFHLTNVLLHAANAWLLFQILAEATGQLWCAAFVAAIFAWHPLRVESVAWTAERKDVLSSFFWFLTTLAYIRYVRSPSRWRYSLVTIFLALGLMAKPMLVTLPFSLLLLDFWPLGRLQAAANDRATGPAGWHALWRLMIVEKLPWFALSFAACIITFIAQRHGGTVNTLEMLSLPVRCVTALLGYVRYLLKLIVPLDLAPYCPLYGRLQDFSPAWLAAATGATLFLILVTIVAYRTRRQHPYLLFGWLWYLGTLVPVIGLVQVGSQSIAYRYTYIPLIGITIAATFALAEWAKRYPSAKRVLEVAGAGVLMACLALTFVQVRRWRDSLTLWQYAETITPPCYVLHNNLGQAHVLNNQYEQARKYFLMAHEAWKNSAPCLLNLGIVSRALRDLPAAESYFRQALTADPDSANGHLLLGYLLGAEGKNAEAIDEFQKARLKKPDHPRAHTALAGMYGKQGEIVAAIQEYQTGVRLDPFDADAHSGYGRFLDSIGRHEEAARELERAFELEPQSIVARNSMANLLLEQKRIAEAARLMDTKDCADEDSLITLGMISERRQDVPEAQRYYAAQGYYEKALTENPKSDDAHYRLGALFTRMGRPEEAAKHLEESVRLNPANLGALVELGTLQIAMNDLVDAVRNFSIALRLQSTNPTIHYYLGFADALSMDWPSAIKHFEDAQRLGMRNAQLLFELAHAQYQAGKQAEAAELYKKARDIDGQWVSSTRTRAWQLATQAGQKGLQVAALYLSQIVCEANNFEDPEDLETLAAAYAGLGQFDQACLYQKQALARPGLGSDRIKSMNERLLQYEHHVAPAGASSK
jgi:tetratricopeptide (TPR) repeat protein